MTMNPALLRSSIALAPTLALLVGSARMYRTDKAASSLMQVIGAACLVTVVLAHFCEALHLLPFMRWGEEDSAGHYLNLLGMVFGLTLFALGYLIHAMHLS